MKTIKNQIKNTIIIDKSKFITNIYPVKTVDEVNTILATINKTYYDATHNCYAYIIDNANIQKCSDDGEPSKTAGYPMLDVLKKQELTDILAVTTRYFGGIKLGAGGLVRAYSTSVSKALENIDFYVTKDLFLYKVTISYQEYNRLSDFLKNEQVIEENFQSEVELIIAFFQAEKELKIEKIKNLTFGKANIVFYKNESVDIKIN